MKTIYILRHFKVKDTTKQKLNSQEFSQWVEFYDNTPLEYKDVNLPKVNKVFASIQNRAIKTVEYLKLEFETTELLKEVEAVPFIDTQKKFSKNFWLVIDRILWFFNFKKKENRVDTVKRVHEFLEQVKDENSILVVSHGLFIKVLVYELEKLGYKGDKNFRAKNGKLYCFRRELEG